MIETRTASSSINSGSMREGMRTVARLPPPTLYRTVACFGATGIASHAQRSSATLPWLSTVVHVHPVSSSRTIVSQ